MDRGFGEMHRGLGDIIGLLSERPRVTDALPALWPTALARRDLLHLPLQLDADLWAALALSTPLTPLPFTGSTTVVAVCGMAGCGKSGAAKELDWAARAVDAYPGGVMWVNADTESTLEAGFRAIAVEKALSTLPGAPPADEKDIDVVKHVLKWLADPYHARWLLVLDNADTEASVLLLLDRFMPPPSSNGHVLVTTRLRAECSAIQALQPSSSLSVSIFSDEDAPVVLLHRSAPRGALSALSFRNAAAPAPSDGDSAARSAWLQDWRRLTNSAKLSEEEASAQRRADVEIAGKGHLNGHPLAIARAAASIASSTEPSKRFESYLKRLNKKGNTALGTLGVSSGDVARRAVTSSFLISFAGLAPHVQLLLRLVASCAPDNVPLALLGGAAARLDAGHPLSTATERGDADQVQRFVSVLVDFSLVSPIENGCVSIHRLVQETVRAVDASNEENVAAISALERCLADELTSVLKKEFVCIGSSAEADHARLCFLHAEDLCTRLLTGGHDEDCKLALCAVTSEKLKEVGKPVAAESRPISVRPRQER